jgi:hypothetical protein
MELCSVSTLATDATVSTGLVLIKLSTIDNRLSTIFTHFHTEYKEDL